MHLRTALLALLVTRCASQLVSRKDADPVVSKVSETGNEAKPSRNEKRSPLELGFVSFDPDPRHAPHFQVPALVQQTLVLNRVPIVVKSAGTSTHDLEERRYLIPCREHRVAPTPRGPHQLNDHKVVINRGVVPVNHANRVIVDQKHPIIDDSSAESGSLHPEIEGRRRTDGVRVIPDHAVPGTIIVEHKPVFVEHHSFHETDRLDYTVPKTYLLRHAPIVLAHPRHENVVVHGVDAILVSPGSQIHEIIVHRRDPKTIVVHRSLNDRNLFRSHLGGFGVGLAYGGHGAGHGFHVPVD